MPAGRIIVGIDHTPAAAAALDWAIAEAAVEDRQLVLVHAFTPTSGRTPGLGSRAMTGSLVQAIRTARERLTDEGVEGDARPGAPSDVLLDITGPADLLVVGASSHHHLREADSTANILIRRAPGALVVVAGPGPATDERPTPAFRSHVVVGVDDSEPSRAALEFAFAYADRHHLPLAAVHVTRHATESDVWFDDRFLETHLGAEPAAAVLLSTMVEPLHLAHPEVDVKRAVVAGHPRTALPRTAHGAALLVVGAPRPGLFDSVGHRAIEEAHCPVAILRGGQPRHPR